MKALSDINRIPWKYILSMNAILLVAAMTFASINTVTKPTDNRSQAAPTTTPSMTSSMITDSTHPPKLFDADISWAKPGDDIVINGENLGTKPFGILKFGEHTIATSQIIDWLPDKIIFTVPQQAITSMVSLTYTTSANQERTLTTQKPINIRSSNPPLLQ